MFVATFIIILVMTYIFTFKNDFNEDDVGVVTVVAAVIAIGSFVLSLLG